MSVTNLKKKDSPTKKSGLLISTDGPDNNVIKIKPPIIINESEADFLAKTIDKSINAYV